jgi:hypothetical protein
MLMLVRTKNNKQCASMCYLCGMCLFMVLLRVVMWFMLLVYVAFANVYVCAYMSCIVVYNVFICFIRVVFVYTLLLCVFICVVRSCLQTVLYMVICVCYVSICICMICIIRSVYMVWIRVYMFCSPMFKQ